MDKDQSRPILLKDVFDIQKRINEDLLHLDDQQKQDLTKQFILAASGELFELLEQINWAAWKQKREIVESNLREEVIDVIKFGLNLCLIWGMDADKFFEEFERKSLVVEQRLKQMKSLDEIKKNNSKVCGIDIDGVIVQYPEHWVAYVNQIKGTDYKTLFDVKKNILGQEYLDLRHEYRQSGQKQFIPLKDYAAEFTRDLKVKEYSIVMLTKRPYKKYFRLFADTKISLDSNNITYDAIVFDTEKHKMIIKQLPQLEFMVEDNRAIANEVGSWGYKCFLVNTIYNQGDVNENVVRVNSLRDILGLI